nr:ribonuclease H-like domain-containing protein [Tanacetum cinerariifolium]
GNPHHDLKDKGVIDNGCSRHMTGNISYLFDFEAIDGGYVAFGGNPKGGKIIGKDTECIVLSSNFKLPDDNPVPLRVPTENNMYNVDLKNIVSSGDLTCLFEKATLDESNLWHRRLGHINFKTMNKLINGSGLTWLFDIDTLTQSMNYQLVVAGNQPNSSADPQNTDAGITFEVKEPEPKVHVSPSRSNKTKKHNDQTKRKAKGKSPVELSIGVRNLSEEFEDFSSNNTKGVNAASTLVTAVEPNSTNSTNTFSAAGPSNIAVSLNFEIGAKSSFVDPSQYPDDSDMPTLEDITYSDNEDDVGVEADVSNLETSITVSPILTSRVHKDHLVTQIIRDLSSAPQIQSMTRMVKDQEELKRVHQAFKDTSWIEAMQEELLQFKMQKEEGIYYEEVFAPVARIEAIRERLIRPCSSKGKKGDILLVQVYVDDIIFGYTNKELCKAFEKLMKDKF